MTFRNIFRALFLIAMISLLIAWVSGIIPAFAEVCEINKNTGAKDCVNYYSPIALLWYLGKFLDHWAAAITTIATIAIGAFTFTLWRATNRLWKAGEIQIQVATHMASAADQSARAAHRTAKIIEDNAQRELRAYVWAEARQITKLNSTEPVTVRIAMRNAGRTPAYKVQISCGVFGGPPNLPIGTIFNSSFASTITVTTIHPGNDEKFALARSSTPLSDTEIANIRNGSQLRLYVDGVVRYVDAFNHEHVTKFLVSTGGPQFVQVFADAASLEKRLPENANIDWEHNNMHNEAD